MTIKYFAYGSNLHPERLGRRLARTIKAECVAVLRGYSLRFHKQGFRDGSGKCNAYRTGNQADNVYGVVFHISDKEKSILDSCEGLGKGYEEATVSVRVLAADETSEALSAVTYLATETHIDASLGTFEWYRGYVLAGARYHRFPDEYIDILGGVSFIKDPDTDRRNCEMKNVAELSGWLGPEEG